ncbi:hypothetical protein QQF64_000643 [Cirrhinus molitorella]|uniref:Uncharacterized protein n=1 Tax=Cirrhinus molitorella TaxID=172907 RepID=A0ABR3NYA1_9TELE
MNGQHRETWTPSENHASSVCLSGALAVKLEVQPTHGSHIVPHARGRSRSDPIEDRFPDGPFEALLSATLFLYCPSVFTTMPTGWRGKAANAARRALHLYSAFTEEGRDRLLRGFHIHEWAGLCMDITSTLFFLSNFCGLII